MKCLSIRAPWWLEIVGDETGPGTKLHENRSGGFSGRDYRGALLIHAAKGCTVSEYADGIDFINSVRAEMGLPPRVFPPRKDMMIGAIVGVCRVVGWEWHPVGYTANGELMPRSPSTEQVLGIRWTCGYKIASTGGARVGSLVLEDVERLGPVPVKGFQGVFNVSAAELGGPAHAVASAYNRLAIKHGSRR